MVAGNGENGAVVLAVGFVELVVLILGFAKVVYDVSQMKEK